jgi:hypothetical protein
MPRWLGVVLFVLLVAVLFVIDVLADENAERMRRYRADD